MRKFLFAAIGMLLLAWVPTAAQRMLSLDSCRALALRNNKQLNVTRLKSEVARNTRKAMRTKYLPKVDLVGGYEYFSKEISILSDNQRAALANVGTKATTGLSQNLGNIVTDMAQRGLITPEMAQHMGTTLGQMATPMAEAGNRIGQEIGDATRTDTKNIWAASVMVRQPLYMGGAITAANHIAQIREQMAHNESDATMQATLFDIDQTYWTVVSLRSKYQLAVSFRNLVSKLNSDVHKMIDEGVATRADGLKVDVRVNEADMQVTQLENGLSLAKMLLCQLCGLSLEEDITLADEVNETQTTGSEQAALAVNEAGSMLNDTQENRPELRMLQNAVDLSREATRLVRAEYLPQVLLTGGYMVSNPNVFNGFQRRFAGVWNVGVMVRVPVWNWFEGDYKIRASKAATNIACMELNDVQEKIDLQIAQSRYKLSEAQKRLSVTQKNIASANENLRCANIGFREGVMETTDVMAAQTAWQQAQSQHIDAQIDLRMSQIGLRRALGVLY